MTFVVLMARGIVRIVDDEDSYEGSIARWKNADSSILRLLLALPVPSIDCRFKTLHWRSQWHTSSTVC